MRQEISIHAPRTGSDAQWYDTIQDCIISIHAPRTGSDTTPRMRSTTTRHFNPRSPHGERRAASSVREVRPLFQSTLPARGATLQANLASGHRYISIHAPRTGSDVVEVYNVVAHNQISIHAPRTGSDGSYFQIPHTMGISIHAPRTGSDIRMCCCRLSRKRFQSTLPARGATIRNRAVNRMVADFNPRSPHGERLHRSDVRHGRAHFNPRSPHGERQFYSRRCNR